MRISERVLIVLILWMTLFSVPILSQKENNILLLLLEMISTLLILKNSISKKLIRACIPCAILWLSLVVTTVTNMGISSRAMNAIVTGYRYVIYFFTIGFYVHKGDYKSIIHELYRITLLLLMIVDAVVVFSHGKGVGGNEVLGNYVIGNKFTVSWLHLFFLALYQTHKMLNNSFSLTQFIAVGIACSIICRLMECTTGIIGCLTIILVVTLMSLSNRFLVLFCNPLVFLAIFYSSTFLLVFSDILISDQLLSSFFLRYSHTSKLLTGRLEMYEIAILYIKKSPWVGFGINYTIVEEILGWGNPQNGILKMLLDHGILGMAALTMLCFYSMSKGHRIGIRNTILIGPFVALLYGFAICSMVEICLSSFFYLALAIVNALNHCDVWNRGGNPSLFDSELSSQHLYEQGEITGIQVDRI